jgi:drug/metabolite transporter, DME family
MVPATEPVPTTNIDSRWLVIASAVLWGSTGTARALGPDDASSAAVGAARIVLGGTALLLVGWRLGWLRPAGRWPVIATIASAAAMAAYQPLFFGAVARTGVAVGTVVGIGSAPVFAGALGVLVRGERPGGRWTVATTLAVAGTVLLVGVGDPSDVDPAGIALAVGAGASYALYILATKFLLDAGLSSNAVVVVTFSLAGVMLVPVAVLAGVGPLASPGGVLVIAHLGLLTVALAYLLFARGLAGVGVGTAGTLSLAEPATAATLGVIVLGERPGPAAVAGLALIAIGLVIVVSIRPHPVRRRHEPGEDRRYA